MEYGVLSNGVVLTESELAEMRGETPQRTGEDRELEELKQFVARSRRETLAVGAISFGADGFVI